MSTSVGQITVLLAIGSAVIIAQILPVAVQSTISPNGLFYSKLTDDSLIESLGVVKNGNNIRFKVLLKSSGYSGHVFALTPHTTINSISYMLN